MLEFIEAVGVFAFALSGALLAVRRGFDVIGILVLAVVTAMGGGVIRDILLGATPPAAFSDWVYFVAPVAATLMTFLFHPALERLMRTVLLFDAIGLGLFCVNGTVTALEAGMGVVAAAALGVITGVGGGLLRDIVARDTPVLVDPRSELYAVPAIAGSLAVAALWHLEAYKAAYGLAIAAAIFVVRLLALQRGWRAPTALPPDALGRSAGTG